jgi:hypothetical protein
VLDAVYPFDGLSAAAASGGPKSYVAFKRMAHQLVSDEGDVDDMPFVAVEIS